MKGRQPAAGCGIDGGAYRTDLGDAELLNRFVSCRDESAFAALVARHGPMVFGVCRRLLRHAQDAEDAFQATFLVFVRKAATIGRRELLGNWLYGVAVRVASRARLVAARHQTRETADMERVAEVARQPGESSEISEAIEVEVQRLPARYRVPVVLYYLEGHTSEEVAGELRCPVGTIKTRLSRAREILRKRLTRRGLVLSAAAFSTALLAEASAATPPALFDSILRAAMSFAAGDGDAVVGKFVSAQAVALTKGVLHTMFVTKMKILAALVLALTVIAGGAGVFAYHSLATEADVKKTDKENIKKTDKENIQGAWKVVSVRINGQDPKDGEGERLKKSTFKITADKMIVKSNDETREHTYKLDPAVKPKTIDIITDQGDGADGIYKLEGDTLTICIPYAPRTERPTEFVSKEDSNTTLVVLKRTKK